MPQHSSRARPRGPPAQLRPPPPTPLCSPRHWGRGVRTFPPAGGVGPARHAWSGPGGRSRRWAGGEPTSRAGCTRGHPRLGKVEVARETRRAERAAVASPAPPPLTCLLGRHAAPSARSPPLRSGPRPEPRRRARQEVPPPVLRHRHRALPKAGAVGEESGRRLRGQPLLLREKCGYHSGTSLWAAPKPARPRNGRSHLMPDFRWVEGLCPRPALDTPSVRAWKALFAATSVPARLSLRLLGGFSGSGTQSAFECGVAPGKSGQDLLPALLLLGGITGCFPGLQAAN